MRVVVSLLGFVRQPPHKSAIWINLGQLSPYTSGPQTVAPFFLGRADPLIHQNPRGLQELLGHRDGRMTAWYTHLSDTYLKAAVNGLNLRPKQPTSPENGTDLAPASTASKR